MDLGKIMIGIALIMLSAGLLVSPSGAAGCDSSCLVGGGIANSPADAAVAPYSPQDIWHGIMGMPIMGAHDDTTCPPGQCFLTEKATHPYER